MKEILNYLFEGKVLPYQEVYELFSKVADGEYSDIEVAALLAVYRMRPIEFEEFKAFRQALLDRSIKVDLSDYDTIDVVGTGGDGKNTFNISTASCFIIAGAGYKVAKHGNYGQSSVSGASNMFEHFGYQFSGNESDLRSNLDQAGICFLHAPLFHPALRNVANVRRTLGVRTLFNLIGPVINPSRPKKQLVGVNSEQTLELYNQLLAEESEGFNIVYSTDGYDEVSLTSPAIVASGNKVDVIKPEEFGFAQLEQEQLSGGKSINDAANIFLNIMHNKATEAQKNVVLANAALGIRCFKPEQSLQDCVAEARESIDSGRALDVFKKLMG